MMFSGVPVPTSPVRAARRRVGPGDGGRHCRHAGDGAGRADVLFLQKPPGTQLCCQAKACAGRPWTTHQPTMFSDRPLTLKLLFRINAEGLIDTVRAEARGRLVDGKSVNAPWQGRCWRDAAQGGMRVPQEGEVAWLLTQGVKPSWRGRTVSSRYEFTDTPVR